MRGIVVVPEVWASRNKRMLDLPVNPNRIQRIAGIALVSMCVILSAGVLRGAAEMTVESAAPQVTIIEDQPAELARAEQGPNYLDDLSPVNEQAGVVTPPLLAVSSEEGGTAKYRTMWMEVTAYCACTKCCGPNAQGITASGKRVSYNRGRFVAADTRLLPFGTKLQIPGYHGGQTVEVIDRGGAIKGHKLDVYFPTHKQAREWGRRRIAVTVLE
jgi:3D (Asp-Asp-Asp) domain-containing protein